MGFFAVLAASLFFVFLFTVFGGYSLLLWCQQSLWMIVPPAVVLAVLEKNKSKSFGTTITFLRKVWKSGKDVRIIFFMTALRQQTESRTLVMC